MVVAIDGPSGVGKSTVSRAVAAALGVPYLDTGSYYRAATLAVLRAGIPLDDAEAVVRVVESSDLDVIGGVIHLDGAPVGAEVRSDAVTASVSAKSS